MRGSKSCWRRGKRVCRLRSIFRHRSVSISDDPSAAGEVGKVGVPINSVDDMLALLDGLPLAQIRQMRTTANAIGPIFAAFVIVALEELGVDHRSFRLFLQNDPLKEYPARGTWIFPPAAGLRFAVDVIEYFAQHHRDWQPINFCGYHLRDAGGTIIQEVGFATANGIAYLQEAQRRGIDVASVVPNLFLFLSASIDIFEEAAKFRAARRLWARVLHEAFGVPEPLAGIRIFSYTLGGALAAREPMNNVARIAFEALAATLGGAQTLATSSWDEAHGLPSEQAAHLSLRTQQILAYEAGVRRVADPLGGSFYVEALTDQIERGIAACAIGILDQGGAVAAIENGHVSRALADAAFREHEDVSLGRKIVVGVNFNPQPEEIYPTAPLTSQAATAAEAVAALKRTREGRDFVRHAKALAALRSAAEGGRNCLPALIEAARARATMGELTDVLARVWGRHQPLVERE